MDCSDLSWMKNRRHLVQRLLLTTNLVVFISGCVTLAFSFFSLLEGADPGLLLSANDVEVPVFRTGAVLTAVLSMLSLAMASMGCVAAMRPTKTLFTVYSAGLIFLFLATMGVAVFELQPGPQAKEVDAALLCSLEQYEPEAKGEAVVAAWDEMQMELRCCGVHNFTDWMKLNDHFGRKQRRQNEGLVPDSCCMRRDIRDYEECAADPEQYWSYGLDGCGDNVYAEINENRTVALVSAIVNGVVLALNWSLSLWACRVYSQPSEQ